MTTEDFIKKAKEIHGDKYDYSNTDLDKKDDKKRVSIICPVHGKFLQNIYSHLKGCGCYKCGKKSMAITQTMTVENFIEKANKAHGFKYDYSLTEYKGCYGKIVIICPIHGAFSQTAYSHLNGHGCPKCATEKNSIKLISNTDEFISKSRKIHGDKYDYSLADYKGARIPIEIICQKGHIFKQIPNKHLQGHGCPICINSHLENEIEMLLNKCNITYEKQKTFEWLKNKGNMFLDFYLPDFNVTIECQGIQHFKDINFGGSVSLVEETKTRDKIKKELCEKHNIKVYYYANYHYDFPYYVYEDKNMLIDDIKRFKC